MRPSLNCSARVSSLSDNPVRIVLRHADRRQTYVAMRPGDVPSGTFRNILKQAGLTEEEFRKL